MLELRAYQASDDLKTHRARGVNHHLLPPSDRRRNVYSRSKYRMDFKPQAPTRVFIVCHSEHDRDYISETCISDLLATFGVSGAYVQWFRYFFGTTVINSARWQRERDGISTVDRNKNGLWPVCSKSNVNYLKGSNPIKSWGDRFLARKAEDVANRYVRSVNANWSGAGSGAIHRCVLSHLLADRRASSSISIRDPLSRAAITAIGCNEWLCARPNA